MLHAKCLLNELLPVLCVKPVIVSLKQPAFSIDGANPTIEVIEGVEVTLADGKSYEFAGKRLGDGEQGIWIF